MCIGFPIQPRSTSTIVQAQVVHATPASILSKVVKSQKPEAVKPKKPKRVRNRKPADKKLKTSKLKKPKRPKTAYNYFQLSEKQRAETGSLVHDERFARNIGSHWKALSKEERRRYQDMADRDRQRYERENSEYMKRLAGGFKSEITEKVSVKAEPGLDVKSSPQGSKRQLQQMSPEQSSKRVKHSNSLPELVDIEYDDGLPEPSGNVDDLDFLLDTSSGSSGNSTPQHDNLLPAPTLDLKDIGFSNFEDGTEDLLTFGGSKFDAALLDESFADGAFAF
mmetsp:Transcript_28768/g.40078  ORF Transcript_28768/g.40078 Transcript_28768/m.40078 type:complete len:279 (-) Transcript_28768:158-994(-)|eukprot:CAMPEP_0184487554 /NCGR_PEP_ID=MMETSP0113_2-20130426/10192_1 /TAXON_ID=91329 /ORGANISM="Norrisiella sphaerica, Strain BC52" /LENGTH=278 /DNA_ID=CAMNT_0026869909 /DNA_START=45 /DNA_END=881 /DNA_ORIENTATION=-